MKTTAQRRWRKLHKRKRTPEYRLTKYLAKGYSLEEIERIMQSPRKAGVKDDAGAVGSDTLAALF
jgi:SOS response regulatory protein OraA/RecX